MQKPIIIFDFNRTLFDPKNDSLFQGALEMLKYFHKQSFQLVLLGKGDAKRREKISNLNIEQYFSEIYIVKEKSLSQLEKIKTANKGRIIYSVGDRIKKEIKLGNILGITTIWFKNGKFSNDIPEFKEETPSYTISSLSELKKIINI